MPNHLTQSASLYLKKHASNPIDWWFWCPEALAIAKAENKPIFLSIGYSSCHWCTVMEGEAFSDEAIAEYINTKFLPIKVDREEQPDIDSIYMQALQMMTGQGGWPLNIFLTPQDLIPFYGGTYFPVEPRYGRPGFLQVLESVRRFYDVEQEKLGQFKQEIANLLHQSTILLPLSADTLTKDLLYSAIKTNIPIIKQNDIGRPSFPMIPYAQLILSGSRFNLDSDDHALDLCQQRGLDLALGGIYDHVGGGFHRYTVDAGWTVPHFEKMLYDNGQIMEYLANLWSQGFHEPAFQRAIAGTATWLQREMTSSQGYFYASQDADSFIEPTANEPEEGTFYIWSYEELVNLLTPEEFTELKQHFTITREGNFEGQNVLQRRQGGELSFDLETALDKLFVARYGNPAHSLATFTPARNNQQAKTTNWLGRIPPVTDTKMIVSWNSLMISGLVRAYSVFGNLLYWELATTATNFILEHQWLNQRLYRLNYDGKPAILAQSEDYALLIKALLDLQNAQPQDSIWLEKAVAIQTEFDDLFWSLELGGYYNNAADDSENLLIRERSYQDNATPSSNGIAITNLVRLALLTENLDYLTKAEQTLQAFSSIMQKSPQACPTLFMALDWYLHPVLVRSRDHVLLEIIPQYFPTNVYHLETNLPTQVIGLVCQGLSCLEPAKTKEQLLEQIKQVAR